MLALTPQPVPSPSRSTRRSGSQTCRPWSPPTPRSTEPSKPRSTTSPAG